MRNEVVTYSCDLCSKAKKKPLEEGEQFSLQFQHKGRTLQTDLCKEHGQALVDNAYQPVAASAARKGSGGQRQRSEPLVDKSDYAALRAWATEKGLVAAGSKGQVKREHQQAWIDAGRPQLPA